MLGTSSTEPSRELQDSVRALIAMAMGIDRSIEEALNLKLRRHFAPRQLESIFFTLGSLESVSRSLAAFRSEIDGFRAHVKSGEIDFRDIGYEQILRVLKGLGLRSKVHLDGLLGDGLSLEIYDTQGIQLFRNFQFMKISGYSILDVTLAPWSQLWTRPRPYEAMMMEMLSTMLQNPDRCYDVQIPEHLVKEVYDGDGGARILSVLFRQLVPLFGESSEAVEGFLVTSNCSILDADQSALSLSFI